MDIPQEPVGPEGLIGLLDSSTVVFATVKR